PAATCWPLSKCTCSTISLTLAVRVTDSRARTVASACTVSLLGSTRTVVVVTGTGADVGAGAACWRQATTPRMQARARQPAGNRDAIDRPAIIQQAVECND